MYFLFQNATTVPVTFDAGTYTDINLPRVDAIAAKDTNGKLWLETTNVDPNEPVVVELNLAKIAAILRRRNLPSNIFGHGFDSASTI